MADQCLVICSWHKGLFFSKSNPGGVDFRDVVTPHSKHGFVHDKHPCQVCGQKGGLKTVCSHPGCVMERDGETIGLYFHPTCARQAGLEATENEQKCYRECISINLVWIGLVPELTVFFF